MSHTYTCFLKSNNTDWYQILKEIVVVLNSPLFLILFYQLTHPSGQMLARHPERFGSDVKIKKSVYIGTQTRTKDENMEPQLSRFTLQP